MDISQIFRVTVQVVASHEKDLDKSANLQSNILKSNKNQTVFSVKTKKIINHIVTLYELLADRELYATRSYSGVCNLNNDDVESVTQDIIHSCSALIIELKRELSEPIVSQQNKEHRQAVFKIIEEHFRKVCKIHKEQQTLLIKKFEDAKNKFKSKVDLNKQETLPRIISNKVDTTDDVKENKDITENSNSSSSKVQELNDDDGYGILSQEELQSAGDVQMLEEENSQLLRELNSLSEEVDQIGSKVSEIAQLQETFTDKVIVQDRELESVFNTVVGTTENVKEANEHIRQAIQRNAGLRVWILFTLLVFSFTLLFLDWYND